MASTDLAALQRRPSAPVYGLAVWGWGLWIGLAIWAAGFAFLPWWAALFLWWWPSMLAGGAVGLFACWVASLSPKRRASEGPAADRSTGSAAE